MTKLYIDLEKETDKYYITFYDLPQCIEVGKDSNGNIIIGIYRHKCSLQEIVEIQDKLREYFRKRGAIIILKHRMIHREKGSEYIYYSIIRIIDTDSGNIIHVVVWG